MSEERQLWRWEEVVDGWKFVATGRAVVRVHSKRSLKF